MTTAGTRMSLYFDKHLWNELDLEACRQQIQPTELVRRAVKLYLKQEGPDELEKLQILNARMFKYIASKLSHVEMLSAIAKNNFVEQKTYQDKLNEIKEYNLQTLDSLIEESL